MPSLKGSSPSHNLFRVLSPHAASVLYERVLVLRLGLSEAFLYLPYGIWSQVLSPFPSQNYLFQSCAYAAYSVPLLSPKRTPKLPRYRHLLLG